MAGCKVSSSERDGEDQGEERKWAGDHSRARMNSSDAETCSLSATVSVSEPVTVLFFK